MDNNTIEELQSIDNDTLETTTLFDIPTSSTDVPEVSHSPTLTLRFDPNSVENVVIDVTNEILSNTDDGDDGDDDDTDEYQELLTKYRVLVQTHNDQLTMYQELQQKYIIDTEIRDNEIQELQQNGQQIVDERIRDETKQSREKYEDAMRENEKLNRMNSDIKNDLADYLFKFDALTDTLQKTKNELIELQEMSKNELILRNNNTQDDINKFRQQTTLIQQQLNERTKENEVLRDENTQNVTKLNSLLTRIDKNDKSCVIN